MNGAGIKILNQVQDDGVSHEGTKTRRHEATKDARGRQGRHIGSVRHLRSPFFQIGRFIYERLVYEPFV